MSEENANHLDESLPQVALLKMITGAWLSQAIYSVASLGIADVLKDGPKHVNEIAREVNAEPNALYRVLRLLASHQIFEEQQHKIFAQTSFSECLEKDSFGSVRSMALLCGEEHYRSWGEILHTLKTGKPAFDSLYHQSFYDYLLQNKPLQKNFHDAMSNMALLGNLAVSNAYAFEEKSTIVDLGGGHGQLLAAVLQQTTETRGVLFDTPPTVSEAHEFLSTSGIEERVSCIGGDFFQEVPSNGDYYVLARLLQNFDDDSCVKILSHCKQSMKPNGKVLIIEMVIPPGNKSFFGKLSDLNMLIMTHGKERTEKEYISLLEKAGLSWSRTIQTESPMSIIEAC